MIKSKSTTIELGLTGDDQSFGNIGSSGYVSKSLRLAGLAVENDVGSRSATLAERVDKRKQVVIAIGGAPW